MFFAGLSFASAATLNLADGRSVQGDIVKQDGKSVEINVDGVNMTYYADEIKDIDGKPLAASPAPAQDQPAAQPTPAPEPQAAAQSDAGSNTDNQAPIDNTAQPTAQADNTDQTENSIQSDNADQTDTANTPAAVTPTVTTPTPAPASTMDPDKKALILKFIDVFGTRQALTNNFEMMLKQVEKEKPDEAQKIRQRVKVDEIIERLLPIYDRNFTSEDLKAFIDFYGSPEGKKLIVTIPELMKESVSISVKYMEEKFPEVKKEQ